jgi:ATP-dependent Clp protease ATP-binding subunit ClpA
MRYIDREVLASLLYMQSAAMNRGLTQVSMDVFVYSLLVSCRETIEEYVDQRVINDILSMLSSGFEESVEDVKKTQVFDLKYDKHISEIIRARRRGGGVMITLFDCMMADKDMHDRLIACGVNISDVQNGASEEAMIQAKVDKKSAPSDSVPKPRTKAAVQSKREIQGEFFVDLTDLARLGQLPEAYGRELETSRVILTLLRKVKGNPLLIGEAGVGKTAIVERLAHMIVDGEVPHRLLNTTIYSVDLASMIAGTNLRGALEEKLQNFLEKVSAMDDVILFIDEVHMIVGAGEGHTSSFDMSNMMKPYLARGKIRCIGATTNSDYSRYMRRDAALCRRFQRIQVNEMSPEETCTILEKCRESYEDFHGVSITQEAIDTVVKLSSRFIADRHFPDKAIDCMDDACARASLYETMVEPSIVEESVSSLSSVPIEIIRSKDNNRLDKAADKIPFEIVGNDEAVRKTCSVLSSAISRSAKRDRPLCMMVVHGPKGVGKKSVVRKLAFEMYGFDSVIEINGNDFAQPHSVSAMVGAPPGYIGYGDDSKTYAAIRRKPYSFILVTNFNMMSQNVRAIFLDIMKTGIIEDAKGVIVDFRHSVLVFCEDDKKTSASMGFTKAQDGFQLERSVWGGILDEIDAEISFNSLSEGDLKKAAWLEANDFIEREESESDVNVDDALITELYNRCQPSSSPSELRRKMRSMLDKTVCHSV